jgi:peptidoglycan hydrolase-like protein with peptidoglycan-binding domain
LSPAEVDPLFEGWPLVGLVHCIRPPPDPNRNDGLGNGGTHMKRLAMLAAAGVIIPTVLTAQVDTSRMRGRGDTARSRTMQSSAGAIGRTSRRNYGLNKDQITQLQTALQQANCNPGPIDGVLGPRTRSAMACARRNNNITGNNPNDLFRSLNLGFTTPDSTGMGGVMSGRRGRGTRGMGADTTMNNGQMGNDTTGRMRRGMGRTGRDTAMHRGARRDSTRRPGTTSRKGTATRPDTTRRP